MCDNATIAVWFGLFCGVVTGCAVMWPAWESLTKRNKRQQAEIERLGQLLLHRADQISMLEKMVRVAVTQPPVQVPTRIPEDMVKRLIFLCHPDKHNNSTPSRVATDYLMRMRSC